MLGSSRNTLKQARKCTDLFKEAIHVDRRNGVIQDVQNSRYISSKNRRNRSQDGSITDSALRNRPWTFIPDETYPGSRHGTSLAQHNLQLAKLADSEDFIGALHRCKQMKDEGVKPDVMTFNYLLDACSRVGMGAEAWAIFEDMQLAGVKPNRQTFVNFINALRREDSESMWEAVDKMSEFGITPSPQTYNLIISRYLSNENLELALQFLVDMKAKGLVPELKTAQGVIFLAARLGFPRLALDLATSFEADSVRKLDPEVWMSCLIASAQDLYVDGVTRCWNIVVDQHNLLPDEGACIDVLHTAARHGLPDLATDVFRVLKLVGALSQEHHFAALIEALCRANRIKDAFLTLDLMRSQDVKPVSTTTFPIFEAITDIEALDATWSIVEDIHKEGKRVDVEVLNVIIQASMTLGDLQRAVGTYKTYSDYGIKPTIDTFNLLLAGCITASHRVLGDRLLAEMKHARLKPNAQSYENIILLCLTQDTYEDAFFYLEEMKASKHVPTSKVYRTLIQKCFSAGDSRYKLALEEMKECGYEIPRRLQTILDQ